jgi:hypothetical protein
VYSSCPAKSQTDMSPCAKAKVFRSMPTVLMICVTSYEQILAVVSKQNWRKKEKKRKEKKKKKKKKKKKRENVPFGHQGTRYYAW